MVEDNPYSKLQLIVKICQKSKKYVAPAGNRTRVCTVAGYYSTTRPLVLLERDIELEYTGLIG